MDDTRIFEDLERRLQADGLESVHVEGIGDGQRGDTLRILLPVTENGDPVLMELMLLRFGEEHDLLCFYATIAVDVTEEARAVLLEALVKWNMHCALGAYGLYEEEDTRQLYHKYAVLSPRDAGPMTVAELALRVLPEVRDIIGEQFPAMVELLGEQEG